MWRLLSICVLLGSCAAAYSVDAEVTKDLLTPVTQRTQAYVANDPAKLTEFTSAVDSLRGLVESGDRVPGAQARPYVATICRLHDEGVAADDRLTQTQKLTYMRSCFILRRLYDEASTL